MSKITSIIISVLILIGAFYFVGNSTSLSNSKTTQIKETNKNIEINNGEIKDGVQYITITARGGYSPKKSTAKSGVPTKLVMKTDGTYDCSASLVIRSLNYRGMLPNTGETVIDVGTPKQGDVLQGVCSMGMYSFMVAFN